MLTFSVSSLAFKCVFYRPEHSVNGRPHEIEFWTSYIVKMKYTNEYSSKSRLEKCAHLSGHMSFVLSESGMVNGLWSYLSWDIEGWNIKKLLYQKKKTPKFCIFKVSHLADGSSEPNNS